MLAGYLVQVAKDGREVMKMTCAGNPPDLLILDLDLAYMSGLSILEKLQNTGSSLPVIVHTFDTQWMRHPVVQRAAGFWEKRGNNIQGFKATIAQVLNECYPARTVSGPQASAQEAERSIGTR
jgi:CheY-like chemotaxis protein